MADALRGVRVAMFNTFAPPPFVGGAEWTVDRDCRTLAEAGASVFLNGLVPPTEQPEVEANRSTVIRRLPLQNSYWPWDEGRPHGVLASSSWQLRDLHSARTSAYVAGLLDEISPDVVITHNLKGWSYAPWVAARSRAVPLVAYVHDYGYVCVKSTRFRKGRVCAGHCAPCLLRSAVSRRAWPGGEVIGVSAAVVERVQQLGVFRGSHLNVVYPEVAHVDAGSQADGGPRASQRARRHRFGFLGRVGLEKGVDLLARASAVLGVSIPIAGYVRPKDRAELERISDRLDFIGMVDGPAFLGSLDCLVVPSLWEEPFGRVVAEAAHVGTAVVIADRPGLREAAVTSGATFREFTSGSWESLRDVMASVMSGEDLWTYPTSGQVIESTSILDVVTRALRTRVPT